jgi:hypothetical protein
MKALLLSLALTLSLVPAALAVETEGEGVNVRHVKNIPHTEARNGDQTNQGTDLEFATITTVPAVTGPTANRREGRPGARKAKRCRAKARRKKSKRARRRALRRCAKRARVRARAADAEPHTPGVQRTFAFAGSYYDGVDIIDVTDPANANRVAHYDCGIGQGDVQVFERDGRHYLLYADDAYDVFASQCTTEVPGRTFEEGSAADDGGGAYVVDVEVRDRRPRRPQDRQAHRLASAAKAGRGRGRGRRLGRQFPELVLVPVDVVAREIVGLLDDPVAGEPAAEGAELRFDPVELGRGQMRQLLEAMEAEVVQLGGELRADALQQQEIVRRPFAVIECSAHRRSDQLAGDIARRRSRLSGEAAALGRARVGHVRANGRAVRQPHALARTEDDERQDKRDRNNDEDDRPVFAKDFHENHHFHCAL